MTDKEAIIQLKADRSVFRSEINEKELRFIEKADLEEFDIAIDALEENTKLKKQKRELEEDSERLFKTIGRQAKTIDSLNKEIEQLKADLEQLNEDTNLTIKETIKAVRNCGENSDCDGCFLRIGLDDCWLCNVELEEAEEALKVKVEECRI